MSFAACGEAKDMKLVSTKLVLIAVRVHLFPSRTQKLSSLAPTIVAGRLAVKIGNANINLHRNVEVFLILREDFFF